MERRSRRIKLEALAHGALLSLIGRCPSFLPVPIRGSLIARSPSSSVFIPPSASANFLSLLWRALLRALLWPPRVIGARVVTSPPHGGAAYRRGAPLLASGAFLEPLVGERALIRMTRAVPWRRAPLLVVSARCTPLLPPPVLEPFRALLILESRLSPSPASSSSPSRDAYRRAPLFSVKFSPGSIPREALLASAATLSARVAPPSAPNSEAGD